MLTKKDIFAFLVFALMLSFPLQEVFNFKELRHEFVALVVSGFLPTIIVLIWFKAKYKLGLYHENFYILTAGLIFIIFMLSLLWIDKNYESAKKQTESGLVSPSVDMSLMGDGCVIKINKNEYDKDCDIYHFIAVQSIFEKLIHKPMSDFSWRVLIIFFGVFQGGLVTAFLYAWAISPPQKAKLDFSKEPKR